MVRIVVPGGISAIFEPCICNNPIMSGARGAGIGVKDAVELELEAKPSERLEIQNVINGEPVKGGVGEIAVKTFFEFLQLEPNYRVVVDQKISIPIGSGFGTSAASALGIVLALSRELGVPLTTVQAGDIAHVAEIRAGSGLGTVSGLVYLGDIVIVAHPGAPSVCMVDRIPLESPDLVLVVASKGRVDTAKALADKSLIDRAYKFGKLAVDNLLKKPTMENFFRISRWFAENVGLLTRSLSHTLDRLSRYVVGAAQAMIGDAVFALVWKEDAEEVLKIIGEELGVEGAIRYPVISGIYYS